MSHGDHTFGCTCRSHIGREWQRSTHWTTDEVAYLEARYGHAADEVIARTLGRSVVGLRLKAKAIGLHKRDAGMTAREVGRLLGLVDSKIVAIWIERGLLKARRGAYWQGLTKVWHISDANLRAFLGAHGQYVDHERVPADSPYRAALPAWVSLPEVRRLTGRDPHAVVREAIKPGVVRAARRGVHWYVRLDDVRLIRPLSPAARDEAIFRRESVLEVRRNRRKLAERRLSESQLYAGYRSVRAG